MVMKPDGVAPPGRERPRMRVQDVMTRDVATVAPGASLKDVARALVARGISGLPVVGEDGEVVGVVSEADVLAKERPAPEEGGALARLMHRADPGAEAKGAARTAGEAMTSPAITIEAFWTIPTAAQIMLEHGVNRLPVVRQGRLVGIVTRADLVRAFARTDEEIAREINEQVALHEALWLENGALDVQVHAGDTTIAGSVRTRTEAEILPKLVARVPGVVSVRSELTWTDDE
jgi:CBS domain-containing protein